MNYNVVTSFNQRYWDEIGKTTIGYLDINWPKHSNLLLYHELDKIPSLFSSRSEWINLYQSCPELPQFVEKWKDHPNANGQKNFRTNAVKFVHKTFAIWDAARRQTSGWLIWLDVDAFVHKPISNNFLETVCPADSMISFMGRPGKYSECGWIGFNLNHPETKDFLDKWENLYISGDFINLPETHDSWTFDYLRKSWPQHEKLFFNVNASATTNKNPFAQSLIGTSIVHAKGADKEYLINRFKNRLI